MLTSTGATSRPTSGEGALRANQAAQQPRTARKARLQTVAPHAIGSLSEDAVAQKRRYSTAIRDCLLAEVLAGIVAFGLLGFSLVLMALPLLIAVWLGLQAWHGIEWIWGLL